MSLSTFCRGCGKHIKIDKEQSVVSQQLKGLEQISREASGAIPAKLSQATNKGSSTSADGLPSSMPVPASAAPTEQALPVQNLHLRETQSHSLSRATKPASGLTNRHKPRRVACFQCDGSLEVSYAAKMATCPDCKEAINLNDYEINKPVYEDVFTRGNVTVNNLGKLECESLVCHNLKVYGAVQTLVHATGDVMIRTRAKLTGGLHCQKLFIGRDAVVEVEGEVYADEMEVDGFITADAFTCVGTTLIEKHGSINGPLNTRSVAMEDGGALNGALQIVSSKPVVAI